jgi:hypothetical protein
MGETPNPARQLHYSNFNSQSEIDLGRQLNSSGDLVPAKIHANKTLMLRVMMGTESDGQGGFARHNHVYTNVH